jgi:hypothetical protein
MTGENEGRVMVLERRSAVVVVVALAGSAVPVSGVTGPTAAAVTAAQDAEFWYVGRMQTRADADNVHYATGSYIRQGVVLTAGHAINGDSRFGVRFEQFQLGATRYFGLGVAHPTFEPEGAVVRGDDVGLILLLNGRANQPGEAFPLLADAGGAHALTQGQSVEVIGFTGPNGTSVKRRGTMSIRTPHGGDITPELYTYRAAGTDSTQPGDSGGPQVHDFGGAVGKRIVATTQSGTGAGVSTGARVDANRSFIDGDGAGPNGYRAIARFAGTGTVDFNDDAVWARGGTGAAQAPRAVDIAVIDPTTGSDRDIVVNVSGDTPALDGLLNDATIRVRNGRTLNVTASNLFSAGSGVLNGGVIDVEDGYFKVEMSVENRGEMRLGVRSGVTIADNSGPVPRPVSLLNGEGALIAVGVDPADVSGDAAIMLVNAPTENRGTIRLGKLGLVDFRSRNTGSFSEPSFVNQSAQSVLDVSGAGAVAAFDAVALNSGEMRVASGGRMEIAAADSGLPVTMLKVTSTGKLNVESGGTLRSLGAASRVNTLEVEAGGQVGVSGGASGAGTLTTDAVRSAGKFTVGSGGTLSVTNFFEARSRSETTITGGAAGPGRADMAALVMSDPLGVTPVAKVTVGKGGVMNLARSALDAATEKTLDIKAGPTLTVAPGGRLFNAGNANLEGTLRLASGNDGLGLAFMTNDPQGNKTNFVSQPNSSLVFERGAGASKPQFITQNADFVSVGTISGAGQFVMTGDTAFKYGGRIGPVSNTLLDFRGIDLVWDGARTATGAAVTMEIFGQNLGAVPAGITSVWGLESMCLMGGTNLRLMDAFSSDGAAGTEALYVKNFGITGANTHLDLNDKIIYYESIDPTCGLNPSLISAGPNGLGRYIQIPSPGWMGLGLVGLVASGRRRRVLAS